MLGFYCKSCQLREALMHTFKHPKYYKELRQLRNKSDQAISDEAATAKVERAPGPGHKLQAREDSTANSTRGRVAEPEATSSQASSGKRQAPSRKRQASSRKLQADES